MGRPLGLVGFGHVTTFVTGQANVSPRIARAEAPSSRTHAESATCASSSCRRSGPSPTATSNAPRARGDTSSTASKTSKPLQLRIDAFAHRFNHTRPHQALGDLTPAEYLSTISQEIAPSHMA